jgi:hypothetical protein
MCVDQPFRDFSHIHCPDRRPGMESVGGYNVTTITDRHQSL